MGKQTFTAGQVLTAAEMNSLQENDYNWTVTTKTASYTLAAGDEGTRIVMDNAGATTITVDDAIFSAGDVVWLHNIGAGTCTVTAGTATVNTAASLDLAQWEGGSLFFTSASSAIFFRGPAAGVATLEASGGTEVTSGGYKYHTFTSSGTLTVSTAGVCEVLVVGGGGGGGLAADTQDAGGGGAGGLVNLTDVYLTATSHTITVGAGGAGQTSVSGHHSPGSETLIGSIIVAVGGGGGGSNGNVSETGGKGGSGGGGTQGRSGGEGVTTQGNVGGSGDGGGGGGAGAAGGAGPGNGGAGSDFSTWATATSTGDSGYYAGGGGGVDNNTTGTGGIGGGGDAAHTTGSGQSGSANTGGGGGGAELNATPGGAGGSGIVIVRYAV